MLYMFNVDVGIMLTFDIKLGMELVSVLQEAIEKAHKIPVDMQVLLVSGGVTLPTNQRVCHFSAGTDTNPIFLYNKEIYNNTNADIPLELLQIDSGPAIPDMNAEVDISLVLPDTVPTVVGRSLLAQKFCELAQEESQICETLVHDQHLQHQGYAAVIANMDDTLPTVKANMEQFVQYYHEFLSTKDHYFHLAETVVDVANTLSAIPLLPTLVDLALQDPFLSIGSVEEFTKKKDNVSLLDWLHLRNSQDSFERLSQMCLRGIQQHTEEIVNSLQAVLNRALIHSMDENMRSIKGLSDRFSGLERLLQEVRILLQEQGDLAKSLQQNVNRLQNIGDVSILPDLCASHRRQLLVMLKNHQKIRDIRRRIIMAKKELIKNIYVRMKWVNGVETEIAAVFEKTSMYYSSLKSLKEQLNILQQTHSIPQLYLTAVSEVVRRRTFSQAYLLWSSDLACQLCAVHSEEVVRRQNFQSQFEGHILNSLFPGLEDMPPTFATQAPEPFDTKLPKLCFEDIELLREKVPDLALSLSVPDLSAITQFFLTKSITTTLKPKDVASIEERLVEVVTAVGLESNLDPTLLQPADSQTSAQSAGPNYTHPMNDRGFESETDTEEFEKVGQSPTDLAFDKQDVQSHHERTHSLREELQKTLTCLREDLDSLKARFFSDQENINKFLCKLSYLYNSEVEQKNEEIFKLREELALQNTDLQNSRCEVDELQQRIKICLDSESREREIRERLEEQHELEKRVYDAEKEKVVKEVTEQLNHDHKLEMDAVRSRFMRVMATASMERSPSECSLERIEKPIDPETSEAIAQVKADMIGEKNRAVAEERHKWQQKLEQEINQIKLRTDAEKQIWFNEAMRRILVEKDRQIEGLRERSLTLEAECHKHQNTINRLTATSGSLGSDSSLLERVEALESAKIKLEAELAEARSTPPISHSTPTHQDMSTSIALIADTGSRDAATSPDPVRRSQFKEKLTKSTTSLIQEGKVSVGSCNEGDVVLVVWDDTYKNYTILQESTSLYFLHSDCLALMSLHVVAEGSPRRRYSLAEVMEREFCRARKPGNRYNVPEGTKFFRVKVKPLMSLPLHLQSSNT